MAKRRPLKLDAEERELLRSLDAGEWRPVKNMHAEMKRYAGYARNTLDKIRKNRRANIRLSQWDLEHLQKKAIEEGIPYQTLMASVLHKYVTGRLVEKRP
ncbi:MAG TPA: antitoxin [Elusimicrobiota bacterium]|nr:antitoxin [Elusimicrobiota bacterium]